MTRRRRGLTPEEQALWNKVADKAVPLHPSRKLSDPARTFASPPPREASREKPLIEPFQIGQSRGETAITSNLALPPGDRLNGQPLRMDHKAHGRMKRGKLRPEAKLDLHGMTLAQAQPALTRFILDQHAKGRRLVLVITGKGRGGDLEGPLPTRKGILKDQVPHWLDSPALRPAVLQVSEAHLKHGGQGAYYVYLRRRR